MSRHTLSNADQLFFGPAYMPMANNGQRGVPFHPAVTMNLGTPASASATAVVNAATVSGAGAVAISGTVTSNAVGQNSAQVLDVPRALQYASSNAGDTTQTVTVTGYDQYEVPMSETITLNGTTAVIGNKAFLYVATVTASAAMTGTLSVGTSGSLGLPYALIDITQLQNAWNAGANDVTTAHFQLGDTTSPATSLTNDPRGLYTPSTAPNGSRKYVVRMTYYDVAANTGGQYTGVFGITQA